MGELYNKLDMPVRLNINVARCVRMVLRLHSVVLLRSGCAHLQSTVLFTQYEHGILFSGTTCRKCGDQSHR